MSVLTERDKWYLAGDYKYLENKLKERKSKKENRGWLT